GRSRPETTVTASRNGSSGLRIGLNSKPAPVVAGVQWLGRSPIGTNTAPKRRVGAAAVRTVGVRAGTIASSSGNARVAPSPRRTVRRGSACFVMNIRCSLSTRHPGGFFSRALDAHLEWYAPHDAEHNRREPVVLLLGIPGNRAHCWHVRGRQAAAERVGQQPFRQRLYEHVRVPDE